MYSQNSGFSSSHVWMWELDDKESWVPKCVWTVVLEQTLESPLDFKEIKPVNPKGNQSLIFIATTETEAETAILCPPDVKNWLIGKDPDAGKDWGWEEKGTAEDDRVVWHHWLYGHECWVTPGVGDGQGSLAYCSLWGHKESDVTEWLNWTNKKLTVNRSLKFLNVAVNWPPVAHILSHIESLRKNKYWKLIISLKILWILIIQNYLIITCKVEVFIKMAMNQEYLNDLMIK